MRQPAALRPVFITSLLVLATSAASSHAAPAASPYQAARECGVCHQSIHKYWSESAHSRAVSPAYRAGLDAAVAAARDKDQARLACIACHAPTAILSGDTQLQQPITQEGVTCDFCHTVADVDLAHTEQPFVLKPGKVKRGPLQYAKSSFHETEYSPLHKTSPLLCAGCHESKNALGAPVLSTYTEWQASPYAARGTICQECHMPLVPGTTLREGLDSSQRRINLHRLVGGSVASMVKSGVSVKIESIERGSATAEILVSVTNSGVGHAAPGGLSSKSLVLAVAIESSDGKLANRLEKVYRRQMLDAQGTELLAAGDLFTKAASVGEDSRLRPKESRSERFTLAVPADARAVVVRLEYRDASDPSGAPKMLLVSEERRPLSGH